MNRKQFKMPTKKKTQCETTGVNAGLLRKAVTRWTKERRAFKLPIDKQPKKPSAAVRAELSYVASMPPPPLPGTPEYYRCMSNWYQCYMQASYLDGYRTQVAQMQQQITNGEIMLTGYLEGYAQCIGGFPV